MRSIFQKYESMPFDYGIADCCQFVGECVESMRGYNPVKPFEYDTEGEANELIGSYGNLRSLVTETMGKPCAFADRRDGDIAIYEQTDGSQILGVVDGDEVVLRSMKGLVRWPIRHASAIWST